MSNNNNNNVMLRLTRVSDYLESAVLCFSDSSTKVDSVIATELETRQNASEVWLPAAVLGPCTVRVIRGADRFYHCTKIEWGCLGTAGYFHVYETPEEIAAQLATGCIK